MTVDQLIAELRKIQENGGGQGHTNVIRLAYWTDDIVTIHLGTPTIPHNQKAELYGET
jgi:hypothetical protein